MKNSTNTSAKSKAEKPTVTPAAQQAKRDFNNKVIIISLLVLSLVTAGTSLAFSLLNYLREDQPVTFNYSDNANSSSFVEGSISEVASRVAPGVVSIITETRTTSWFYGQSTQTSAGTGMIVSKDGYILTNKHVVEGANSISVILDDGTTYDKVKLVGTDPLNDVAFLKINGVNDLPSVTLGDSKTISAGQQVVAIGNALGQYQNTVTYGVISGTGRTLTAYSNDHTSSEKLSDMIQTDAAINAGNSGGPLVNAAGQVIGINTATSSEADGIGFAIPISSVKGMLKNIINNGSAERAYMGVYYLNVTPDVATTYDLPVTTGAYLLGSSQNAAIISGGPGDKAGLKEKDIITKVNGVNVGKAGTVSTLIGEFAPGDTVQLTVLRNGEEKTINLTLAGYTENKGQSKS